LTHQKAHNEEKERDSLELDDSFNFSKLEKMLSEQEVKSSRDRNVLSEDIVLAPSRAPSQSSRNL